MPVVILSPTISPVPLNRQTNLALDIELPGAALAPVAGLMLLCGKTRFSTLFTPPADGSHFYKVVGIMFDQPGDYHLDVVLALLGNAGTISCFRGSGTISAVGETGKSKGDMNMTINGNIYSEPEFLRTASKENIERAIAISVPLAAEPPGEIVTVLEMGALAKTAQTIQSIDSPQLKEADLEVLLKAISDIESLPHASRRWFDAGEKNARERIRECAVEWTRRTLPSVPALKSRQKIFRDIRRIVTELPADLDREQRNVDAAAIVMNRTIEVITRRMKTGDLDDAAEEVRRAAQTYPDEMEIVNLDMEIRSAIRRSKDMLDDARDHLGHQEHSHADAKVAEALKLRPSWRESTTLENEIRRARRKADALVDEARRYWTKQDREKALSKIQEALSQYGGHDEAIKLRAEIEGRDVPPPPPPESDGVGKALGDVEKLLEQNPGAAAEKLLGMIESTLPYEHSERYSRLLSRALKALPPQDALFLKSQSAGVLNWCLLPDETVMIGRSPDAHIRIPNELKGVSREHAEITRRNESYILRVKERDKPIALSDETRIVLVPDRSVGELYPGQEWPLTDGLIGLPDGIMIEVKIIPAPTGRGPQLMLQPRKGMSMETIYLLSKSPTFNQAGEPAAATDKPAVIFERMHGQWIMRRMVTNSPRELIMPGRVIQFGQEKWTARDLEERQV